MCPKNNATTSNSHVRVTKLQYSVYSGSLAAILSFLHMRNIWQSIRHFVKRLVESRQTTSCESELTIAEARVAWGLSADSEAVEPMSDNATPCPRCEIDIYLKVENSVFYLFVYQPWVSYWHVICPNCSQQMRCFVRDNLKEEHDWAERNHIGMITQFFPGAEELAGFEETYDVHSISAHDLSDYEEKEVAFFRYLLDKYSPYEELE